MQKQESVFDVFKDCLPGSAPTQLDPVALAKQLSETWQGQCAVWFFTYGIEVPDGYKVIGYHYPKPGEILLGSDGRHETAKKVWSCKRPILERIKPATKWVVPTDEDAKRRPKCRVRQSINDSWQDATLHYVCSEDKPYPYLCSFSDHDDIDEICSGFFMFCEIEVEDTNEAHKQEA